MMVEGNPEEDRQQKEQKIEQYLEEYRQKLGSQEILNSKPTPVEGIEDILDEFRARSSPQQATPEQPTPELPTPESPTPEQPASPNETWLPDRISQEELNEFDSGDLLEAQLESDLEGYRAISGEFPGDESAQLYEKATVLVLESICRAEKDQSPDVEEGKRVVRQMDDSISKDASLLLAATDRIQEFAVSTHCVNVAILGLRIAQSLNYSEESKMNVGLAALLHEIGVVKLSRRMVHERGKVDQEVRHRPVYSAEILERLGSEYDWLVQTVRQVYEREDGTGFPLGLKGKDIREEAKILGIVDVLEACIHERPYRRAMTGYQLFHELTSAANQRFESRIVKALLKCFSLYPYNEYVLLNTGEIGKVIEIRETNLLRPKLRMLYDSSGRPLEDGPELDLESNPSRHINKAITYHQLPAKG
jgi:HD-GYP domain-containing protein (c-di-GMP phosphodiesterase class II)